MVINTTNIIRCSHCYIHNHTRIAERFYKCNKCGSSYHYNTDIFNSGFMQTTNSNHKNNLLVIIMVALIAICLVIYLGANMFRQSDKLDNRDIITRVQDKNNSTEKTDFNASVVAAYARTAFVLYQDKTDHNSYLFRADFVTNNNDNNDQHAVNIQIVDGQYIAYDALSDKLIPNFNQLKDSPLSFDAVILYADNDNLIVKNKIADDYQLEMLDAYTGDIIWTLSNKELLGIENLTGKYSSQQNNGIELQENEFMIKLQTNYYLINKEGNIIDYGQLD